MANTNTNPEVLFDITQSAKASPARAPKVAKPAEVIPERTDAYSSPGISAEGAERAKADEVAAKAAGFAVQPPIYTIGSLVNSIGVENFRSSREDYEALPNVSDACTKLIGLVAGERRKDVVVDAADLQMLEDGRLTRGGGALMVSERALSGLANFVTPGGAAYLKACPTDLRALNVNHWLERAVVEDARATKQLVGEWEDEGCNGPQPGPVMRLREITLRTRTNTNRREVFAVVGPRYGAHDVDAIAEQVMQAPAIPKGAKCEIVYDGYKARMDVLFHSNVQPERVVAGEIFKAGILVKTADDGSGSIQISAQVWRNLCLNLIIVDHAREMTMRRRHFGEGIADAVERGIANAMTKVKYFADAWSEARETNVVEQYEAESMEDIFRRLVATKTVHVPGVRPEAMFASLVSAWEKEPGTDVTSVVNAVTRTAHEANLPHWEAVEEMERLGGQLLFAKRWDLAVTPAELEKLSY